MDAELAHGGHERRQRMLSPVDLGADPLIACGRWVDEAVAAGLPLANSMTLATADTEGRPSARTVLLRSLGLDGFVFFTNYDSRKGRELAANPACALVLCWVPLDRQVTATGRAERLPVEESDAYFASRPRGSRLGAWASAQSQVIACRGVLDTRMAELEETYRDVDIPRPAHWGGYRVVPGAVELWQGRPDRLHDRIRYRREDDHSAWVMERLAP